jgi:sulfofructose kinase
MRATILCAGIIVLDEVFQVDRFPRPDEKIQAQSFFIVNGGCAANAAVAVVRLGGRAALAGPLGDDANGERVLAALAQEEVDCSGCQRLVGTPTAVSAIFLDPHGERMIVTHCDDRLAAARPINPARLVASADAVLADNRFPEFVRPICEAARARGLMVVLDADRPTQICDELFGIATHVVFSSECLRATTGREDLAAGLAAVAATTSAFLAVTHARTTCSGARARQCARARCSRWTRSTRWARATCFTARSRSPWRRGARWPRRFGLPRRPRGSNARASAAAGGPLDAARSRLCSRGRPRANLSCRRKLF